MKLRAYVLQSIGHFWRPNFAVVLGAAVGAAALTGALIVGDSMRGSLRDTALGRLGQVQFALVGQRFFREALAAEMAANGDFASKSAVVCPVILLRGAVIHADKRTRADRVNVFGVGDCFWALGDGASDMGQGQRSIMVNDALATELGISAGEDILIRAQTQAAISTDALFGRRDESVATIRGVVERVVSSTGIGAFSLNPSQAVARNVYVPLADLQRSLKTEGHVNVILVGKPDRDRHPHHWRPDDLYADSVLRQYITLADYGLRMRVDEQHGYASLESDSLLIPMAVEHSVNLGTDSLSRVLAHLANSTRREPAADDPLTAIPYSIVAAVDPESWDGRILTGTEWRDPPGLVSGEILLNEWAANDLGAKVGDAISLAYYVTGELGAIDERTANFTLRGILPLTGLATDPGYVPKYEGITDTQNLADWNPPFPIDLRRIRLQDEEYWDKYRTTPKAFITLDDGQRLWADQPERFGRLTSVRVACDLADPVDGGLDNMPPAVVTAMARLVGKYSREIRARLQPSSMGFSWEPLRMRAEETSRGSTDFGMLFIGFSSFLIISAAMLVALLFRLGIERRAYEIGLLLAQGFTPRAVATLFVVQGLALAVIGAVVGVVASAGYAWLMLSGLRSWWSAAVNAPFLRLHIMPLTVCLGFLVSVLIAMGSMVLSIRGLSRRPTRALLAGAVSGTDVDRRRQRRGAKRLAGVSLAITVGLAAYGMFASAEQQVLAFFLGGVAALVSCLSFLLVLLRSQPQAAIQRPGSVATVRLGLRNAPRNVQRSMLTAGLIASAAFVIVSLEAFRLGPQQERGESGGTGGFALLAESAVPLPYDLNSKEGRESLGVEDPLLENTRVMSFRLRSGDEASCLNLYRPSEPRILGVPPEFIERGGFRFARSIDQKDSPWTLLQSSLPGGVIPVIGDEAAVRWQLHLGLGQDLVVRDERGAEARLRFVALLKNSVLQNEILIADRNFTQLFPSISGRQFFLIEAPADRAGEVEAALERELERFGFDATPTARRLAEFLAVQNTYLSTFQTLGGIGLMLGAAGLAAVMLRNVWERRSELALLQALGFSRRALSIMVLSENYALALAGLGCAALSAVLAIAPNLLASEAAVPWASLAGVFAGVLVVVPLFGMIALGALRGSLLQSVRNE